MSLKRMVFSFLVDSAIRSAKDRIDPAELKQRIEKLSFESDTAKMGVRMTRQLRDKMRQHWLRVVKPADDADNDGSGTP